MTSHILFIGEVMAEIRRAEAGFAVGFAGDTFNAAVYCKRQAGQDFKVAYQTCIGGDPLSAGFLELAQSEDIDISNVRKAHGHNLGIYAVQTDAKGERSFAYWRNQSAARMLFQSEQDLEALNTADILYYSGISLAILSPEARGALLQALTDRRKAGARIAFDSNYRPSLWEDAKTAQDWIARAWSMTDIALPSVDDEMALFGDRDDAGVLARLRALGCSSGALKRAALGPLPIADGATPGGPFPQADTVVDTTAAGDSFNGGYLAGVLRGLPAEDCLALGHATARYVVSKPGAIVDWPPG